MRRCRSRWVEPVSMLATWMTMFADDVAGSVTSRWALAARSPNEPRTVVIMAWRLLAPGRAARRRGFNHLLPPLPGNPVERTATLG